MGLDFSVGFIYIVFCLVYDDQHIKVIACPFTRDRSENENINRIKPLGKINGNRFCVFKGNHI